MPLTQFCRTAFAAILLSGAPPLCFAEEPPMMDPDAQQVLQGMSDYLATLKQFTVSGDVSTEDVLGSGQKLMFHRQFQVDIRRPDRLRLARWSADEDHELYYDGQQVTLFGKTRQLYAVAEAPSTLDETLDYVAEVLGIATAGRDLLYQNVYNELVSDVVSGSYIGQAVVGGVLCNHLAFRSNEVDWQIWIEDGDKPLPRKYVIVSRWLTGAPEYVLWMREWNLSTDLQDARFRFEAPEGASQIRFLPLDSASAANDT